MFFGALLSAIMSTASGTLLAPSVTFSENILRGFFAHLSDKQFLWITRVVVVCFTGVVLVTAFNSEMSIYGMVENAYKITLVAAFIPLVFGLYWKRATTQGALAAIAAGLSVWLLLEYFEPEGLWPPQLAGLIAAFLGMIAGSLLPQWVRRRTEHPPEHPLGHAAAHPHAHGPGHTHHHGASN